MLASRDPRGRAAGRCFSKVCAEITGVARGTSTQRRAELRDLQDIVRTLKSKGAVLKATEQPIDTGTSRRQVLPRYARVFAEFETNLSAESSRTRLGPRAGVMDTQRRTRCPITYKASRVPADFWSSTVQGAGKRRGITSSDFKFRSP